jgi:hypothetical protein
MSANTAAGNSLEFVEMKGVVETILPNEADDYVGDGPVRCFSGRPRRTAAEQSSIYDSRDTVACGGRPRFLQKVE